MNSFYEDIIENTVNNYGGRKIIVWGAHATSERISMLLMDKYGIETAFKVDSNKGKVDGIGVRDIDCLRNKSAEYYVVVPIGIYESVRNMLTEFGYIKNKDYYYFCDCIKTESKEYFEDWHGNRIYGNRNNVKFVFSGFNSSVILDQSFRIDKMITLYIDSNSEIKIGSNCISIGDGTVFYARDNSSIEFQAGCVLGGENTVLKIGEDSSIRFAPECELKGTDTFLEANEKSEIKFNEGCVIGGGKTAINVIQKSGIK